MTDEELLAEFAWRQAAQIDRNERFGLGAVGDSRALELWREIQKRGLYEQAHAAVKQLRAEA